MHDGHGVEGVVDLMSDGAGELADGSQPARADELGLVRLKVPTMALKARLSLSSSSRPSGRARGE